MLFSCNLHYGFVNVAVSFNGPEKYFIQVFGVFLIHARLRRDLCGGIHTLSKSNSGVSRPRVLFPCSFALCSIFICLALYVRVIYRAAKHCSQFSLRIDSTACTRETIAIDTQEMHCEENSGATSNSPSLSSTGNFE